ncbi:hypothetical protein VLG1_02250 [Lactobacillus paragasseri]
MLLLPQAAKVKATPESKVNVLINLPFFIKFSSNNIGQVDIFNFSTEKILNKSRKKGRQI